MTIQFIRKCYPIKMYIAKQIKQSLANMDITNHLG